MSNETDKEIEIMAAAYAALSALPKEARPRVFEWLNSRLEYDDEQESQRILEMERTICSN